MRKQVLKANELEGLAEYSMSNRTLTLAARVEAHRRRAAEHLKSCPLCGAINATENFECFACRWAGQFDQDAETVQCGLDELISRCPELAEALTHPPKRALEPFTTLRIWLTGLFRPHLDILV